MRVLSRITEPTSGSVEITGSVASLLEVGTGFHPELSGRENIFLSGAIMGMTRKEIEARFDEIVAFSEVERFMDTPVKRYSSGMYVRLGFAVAAHLDAEILLIDEVLAVGDARFQRKCLAKMHEISAQGRTIVFISHQLVSVESLCTRLMVMSDGGIVYDGELKKGLEYYLQSDMREAVTPKWNEMDREGNGLARVSEFYIVSEQGARLDQVQSGQNISLVFGLDLGQQPMSDGLSVDFAIHTASGERIIVLASDYTDVSFDGLHGSVEIACRIMDLPLTAGRYPVSCRILADGETADAPVGYVGEINVREGDFFGSGVRWHSTVGKFLIRGEWEARSGTAESRTLQSPG
jgi:lipopolysaccharide transport system ATP-binding protein